MYLITSNIDLNFALHQFVLNLDLGEALVLVLNVNLTSFVDISININIHLVYQLGLS